ncbi:MAG TPA: hypothetical protein PL001_11540, partial [Candidatus Kryptobacter bacterium]|nr:hypothetical protein [Candidatus Kryptobacter bacterium]
MKIKWIQALERACAHESGLFSPLFCQVGYGVEKDTSMRFLVSALLDDMFFEVWDRTPKHGKRDRAHLHLSAKACYFRPGLKVKVSSGLRGFERER